MYLFICVYLKQLGHINHFQVPLQIPEPRVEPTCCKSFMNAGLFLTSEVKAYKYINSLRAPRCIYVLFYFGKDEEFRLWATQWRTSVSTGTEKGRRRCTGGKRLGSWLLLIKLLLDLYRTPVWVWHTEVLLAHSLPLEVGEYCVKFFFFNHI